MLIGLVGYKFAGKTTVVGRHLTHRHGFKRHRFAEPLKNMLRALGLDDYWLDGPGKELPCSMIGGKTPVQALQTLGTDWGREMISPTLWVDAWKHQALMEGGHIFADDCRFPNEADAIHAMRGFLIRIDRPEIGRTSVHASEDYVEHAPVKYVVKNTGAPEYVTAQIDEIIKGEKTQQSVC